MDPEKAAEIQRITEKYLREKEAADTEACAAALGENDDDAEAR